ncbi:MAG: Ig-like domain-containing protein [Myxococcales bacterium]
MNRFLLLALSAALLAGPACSSTPNAEQPGLDASVAAGPDAAQPTPVTCTIAAPAGGALVTGTVEFRVEFQGPATKVEILEGDTSLASADVTTSPATVAVDTTQLKEGAHTFKAKASSAEASGESAAVALTTDNQAPAITLGATNLSILKGTAAVIPIVATEAHVAKVQLLEGDTVLVDLTEVPDDILWDTTKVADGLHAVKLSVSDTLGHVTVSPEKKVIVGNYAVLPQIEYIPADQVTVPEDWQTVEIDVRGMVANPGAIKHILTWLSWDSDGDGDADAARVLAGPGPVPAPRHQVHRPGVDGGADHPGPEAQRRDLHRGAGGQLPLEGRPDDVPGQQRPGDRGLVLRPHRHHGRGGSRRADASRQDALRALHRVRRDGPRAVPVCHFGRRPGSAAAAGPLQPAAACWGR